QLERSPSAFVLGTRTFDRDVPLANRVGNVAARGLFRLLVRRRITDTQTGLRGIPAAFLAELIEIEEVRYDFELEMLVRAVARELSIVELPIQTVYGVTGQSHFQPLGDSLRIVRVFLRLAGRLSNARTDWDAYHRSPSLLAPLTRRVTARAIAATVRRF